MAARRLLLAAAAAVSLSLVTSAANLSTVVRAEEVPTEQAETAKQQWIGVVNANAVYVRSAARDDAYAVMKLDKGTQVTVAGLRFKWLKIVPPEGSFAYVPKAYVERHGSGNVGRATREIIAKVGSTLNQLKVNPMAKVEQGQDVQIIEEQDDYYKIKPPAGSYLYISQQLVDPYKPVDGAGPATAEPQKEKMPAAPRGEATTPRGIVVDQLTSNNGSHHTGSTSPTTQPGGDESAAAPATQPSDPVTVASETFDHLEGDFKAANEKSITDQPIAQLLSGYQDLLKQDALPTSMRRIAETRVATLKLRNDAKEDYLATRAAQEKAMERRKALQAEHEEIEERIKQNQITVYAAVGTLRTSSLQHGNQTLYRLTDPQSGRTVAYLRTNDAKYAGMLGQFIGVKGVITTDTALNMKTINQPTEAAPIDQSKVNKTITAQIVPPSLLPTIRSASTSGE